MGRTNKNFAELYYLRGQVCLCLQVPFQISSAYGGGVQDEPAILLFEELAEDVQQGERADGSLFSINLSSWAN